jgi:hypothetical protein
MMKDTKYEQKYKQAVSRDMVFLPHPFSSPPALSHIFPATTFVDDGILSKDSEVIRYGKVIHCLLDESENMNNGMSERVMRVHEGKNAVLLSSLSGAAGFYSTTDDCH